MSCDASHYLAALQAAALETPDAHALGARLMAEIRGQMPQAAWAGIYWLRAGTLVLGPYEGKEPLHPRIAVGEGICGRAVADDEDQVVDDVREVEHYLACSPTVRSEIVVLIRAHGAIVGQIDVDSDSVGAFSSDDHCVLRAVADGFGGLLASLPSLAGGEPEAAGDDGDAQARTGADEDAA